MELFHRYEITTRNTRLQETNRDDEVSELNLTHVIFFFFTFERQLHVPHQIPNHSKLHFYN